jgi:hypothetical protein
MILNGLLGIIYFLFLGQETYVSQWSRRLVGTYVKNTDNLYQYVRKLKKNKVIIDLKTMKSQKGSPVIRTSDFTHFFQILITVKPEIQDEQLLRIKKYIEKIGNTSEFFPDYIIMTFPNPKDYKKMKWPIIVGTFLNFVLGLMVLNNPSKKLNYRNAAKVITDIQGTEFIPSRFEPIRLALETLSEDFDEIYQYSTYEKDTILISELANLCLYGPKAEYVKNTVGYSFRKRYAEEN